MMIFKFLSIMKKSDLALLVSSHRLWDGTSKEFLEKNYTKEELQDAYDNLYWEDGTEKAIDEIGA